MAKKSKLPTQPPIDVNPGVRAWLVGHYSFDDLQLREIASRVPSDAKGKPYEYTARVHLAAENLAHNRSGEHDDHWLNSSVGQNLLVYLHDRLFQYRVPIRDTSAAINQALEKASLFQYEGTYDDALRLTYNWLEQYKIRELQQQIVDTNDVEFERIGKPNRLGDAMPTKAASKNKVCRNKWANVKEHMDTVLNAIAKAYALSLNQGGPTEAEQWAKAIAGIGPTGDWYDYEGDAAPLVTEIRRVANEARKQKLAADEAAKAKEREQIDEALAEPADEAPADGQTDTEETQEPVDEPRYSGETQSASAIPMFEASFTLANPKGIPITFTIKAKSGSEGLPIVNAAIDALLDARMGYTIPVAPAAAAPGKASKAATNSMDGDSGTAVCTLITVGSSQKGKPQLKLKLKGQERPILFTARNNESELVTFLKNATYEGEKFTLEALQEEGEFSGKWNVDWKKNASDSGTVYTNAVAIRD